MRQEVRSITQNDTVDEESLEDDEGVQDEREIWEVTQGSEEEEETTKDEGVDLLAELLELSGWSQVNVGQGDGEGLVLIIIVLMIV